MPHRRPNRRSSQQSVIRNSPRASAPGVIPAIAWANPMPWGETPSSGLRTRALLEGRVPAPHVAIRGIERDLRELGELEGGEQGAVGDRRAIAGDELAVGH